MIPRWSWENRGLIETRITALINAINATEHTWEHFLHQLSPSDEDHWSLLPGRPGSKLQAGENITEYVLTNRFNLKFIQKDA